MTPRTKELVLVSLLALSAIVFWLSLSVLLPHLSWTPTPVWWSAVTAAFLMILFWSMAVILVDSAFTIAVAWAVACFSGVVWFLSPVFLGTASLLFVFGIIGFLRTKHEIQNTLHGRLAGPIRKATPLMVTFLVLAFASAAYVKAPTQSFQLKDVFPEYVFEKTITVAEPVIKKIIPTFGRDVSVGDYALSALPPTMDKITPAQKDQIKNEFIQKIQQEYGLRFNAEDRLVHVMYLISINFLEREIHMYDRFVPVAIAMSLFVTVRLLALPLYLFAIGIAILLLKLLYRAGVVELRAIPATITAYTFK